jgi:hypothetical protein
VSALALTVGGVIAVTEGTVAAKKIKPDGTVACTGNTATIGFSPGLKITPTKKVLLSFNSTAANCVVTNGVGGAENINNILLTGTGKLKNAGATGLLGTPGSAPTVIKVKATFRNGATIVCENKAKLVSGAPTFINGGQNIVFNTTSAAVGGKNLGGKCFKGKAMTSAGQLAETVAQLGALVAGPNGITNLSINDPAATTNVG